MVDDDPECLVECQSCENITFSTDPEERFCGSCGHPVPMSILFKRAWEEVEEEDIYDIIYEEGQLCDEDFHFCLVIRQKILEALLTEEDLFYLKQNFCSFCGKKLPKKLPQRLQRRLKKKILEIKKRLPDRLSPDYFEALNDQLSEIE